MEGGRKEEAQGQLTPVPPSAIPRHCLEGLGAAPEGTKQPLSLWVQPLPRPGDPRGTPAPTWPLI